MSRNVYDPTNDTLNQIAGWQAVDSSLSSTSENPVQNKILKGALDKTYKDDDSAETTLADGDYFPFYDTSATTKKKTLWSNIVSAMKSAFGISSSGGTSTYLRKDGSWGTPPSSTSYISSTTLTSSVPSGTETNICELTIPSDGNYIINAQAGFTTDINSYTAFLIRLGSSNITKIGKDKVTNGDMFNATLVRNFSTGNMVRIRIYQASGSSKTANNVYLSAICIE